MTDPRQDLLARDIAAIEEGAREYGPSWKQRGGVGAYMVAIRKWDRMLVQLARAGGDWEEAIGRDARPEGIMDDIRDLRCYLRMIAAQRITTDPAPLAYLEQLDKIAIIFDTRFSSPDSVMRRLEECARGVAYDIFLLPPGEIDRLLVTAITWLTNLDLDYGSLVPRVAKTGDARCCYAHITGGVMFALTPDYFEPPTPGRSAICLSGDRVTFEPGSVLCRVLSTAE